MRAFAVVALLVAVPAIRPAPPGGQDARPAFSEWLDALRAEAIGRGIKRDVVDAALAGVEEPLPVILERDRAQAETVFSLEQYVARRLTAKVITNGREA